MGDPRAQTGQDILAHSLGSLNQSLPDILKAITTAVPSLAKSQLTAEQETSPAYNELLTNLYSKYAPQLAKTGSDIESGQREASAKTDLSILGGPGKSIGREAESLNRELNPQFYAGRETGGKKLGELLTSVNLNNANPEAERLVSQESARSGTLTTPSSTSTVSNALSFGNELQKRRNALGQALNVASGFLPATKSDVGVGFAGGTIGRTPTGQGTSQFGGVQGGTAGAEGQGLVSNIFGQGTQAQMQYNQLNQQRRDVLDRVTQAVGATPSY